MKKIILTVCVLMGLSFSAIASDVVKYDKKVKNNDSLSKLDVVKYDKKVKNNDSLSKPNLPVCYGCEHSQIKANHPMEK